MPSAGSRIADCRDPVGRQATLQVHVPHVDAWVLDVVLNRTHRDPAGPLERRHRKVGLADDDPWRRRRVGDRDDQLLLIVERVVEAVAAAQRGALVAADIPGGAEHEARTWPGILVQRPDRRRGREQVGHVHVAGIDWHRRHLHAEASVDRHVAARGPVVLHVGAEQRPVPLPVDVALGRQADERRRGAGEERRETREAIDAAAEGRIELRRADSARRGRRPSAGDGHARASHRPGR